MNISDSLENGGNKVKSFGRSVNKNISGPMIILIGLLTLPLGLVFIVIGIILIIVGSKKEKKREEFLTIDQKKRIEDEHVKHLNINKSMLDLGFEWSGNRWKKNNASYSQRSAEKFLNNKQ